MEGELRKRQQRKADGKVSLGKKAIEELQSMAEASVGWLRKRRKEYWFETTNKSRKLGSTDNMELGIDFKKPCSQLANPSKR